MTTVCSPPPPFWHCGFEYPLPGTCDVSGLTLIRPKIVSCCPDWNPLVGAGGDNSLFTPPLWQHGFKHHLLGIRDVADLSVPWSSLDWYPFTRASHHRSRAEDAELTVVAGEEASISQIGEFPVLTTFIGVFTVEGKKLVWPSLNICWSDVFR